MLTDRLTQALEAAADTQPFVPEYRDAFCAGRRRRRRRSQVVAGALVVTLGAGIGVGVAAWPNGSQVSSIHAVQQTATPDPELNGPKGPLGEPIYGRAYPVGSATTMDGQHATVIAYEASFTPSPVSADTSGLCFATWQPGQTLSKARPFGCVDDTPDGAVTFQPVTADGTTYVGSKQVKEVNILHSDLIGSLPRTVSRAELIVAKMSDVPDKPPTKGQTVKTQRIPVGLLNSGDVDAPALIAVVSALPSDYIVLGLDAWDAQGHRIIHELTDSYCGASPAGAVRYPIQFGRRPLAC